MVGGSVSVQDSASEAGHSTAPPSQTGEQHSSRHRALARPGTAHSEAGSTDAASIQTVRGSEATLGDVAEGLNKDNPEVVLSPPQDMCDPHSPAFGLSAWLHVVHRDLEYLW